MSDITLHNDFCHALGIAVPIIQAPMAGGWTTPQLVAAVSNAGGLGMLAAGGTTPDQLAAAVDTTHRLTARPFGVNFLLAPPEPAPPSIAPMQDVLDDARARLGLPPGARELSMPPSALEAQLDIVREARTPIVSFAMGNPGPLVDRLHEHGALVGAMVTTVREAEDVAAAGVDFLVAQGAEAGGHRSTFRVDGELPLVGTMALVPQIVDAVRLPVVAAGGIADGRGVAAALALGAAGVQLGTRFLVASESGTFAAYRARLVEATEENTILTERFSGRPARGLPNQFTALVQQSPEVSLPWPYQWLAAADVYHHAMQRGDADWLPLLAGQGLRLIKEEQAAASIVGELVRETVATLERLADLGRLQGSGA